MAYIGFYPPICILGRKAYILKPAVAYNRRFLEVLIEVAQYPLATYLKLREDLKYCLM